MKKQITLISFLFFIIINSIAQTKVGTVDSEYIISKMPEIETVNKFTEKYGKKLDSSFQIKVEEYKNKAETYKTTVKTMTDEIKKTKYTELIELENDLQKYKQNGVQLMQLKRDELLRPLYKKLTEIIAQVAKENSYTQILTTTGNQFAFLDEKFDVTELVLKKLGIE